MTSLFDGIAGLLNDTLGGPVLHTPKLGAPRIIKARFRRKPMEVLDLDGMSSLIHEPTLRVPNPVASTIASQDQITPENGDLYEVLNRHESGSPAVDAFVTFKLRKV